MKLIGSEIAAHQLKRIERLEKAIDKLVRSDMLLGLDLAGDLFDIINEPIIIKQNTQTGGIEFEKIPLDKFYRDPDELDN